jgi:hypothetical protein
MKIDVPAGRLPFVLHVEDQPDLGQGEPRRLGVLDEPEAID